MKTVHLFIIIIILTFIAACRKEKVVTVTKEIPQVRSWLLDSSIFNYEKILLTSVPMNDSVLVVATGLSIWFINSNHLNTSIDGAYINFSSSTDGYLTQPILSDQIGLTVLDSNHVRIFSLLAPVPRNINASFIFSPNYHDAESAKYLPPIYAPVNSYPNINSKYLLIPYETNYNTQKAYVSLLQVEQPNTLPTDPNGNFISLAANKTIILTPDPSTTGFAENDYFSAAYFSKFFLYYNDQFYKIDTLGNVKSYGNSPAGASQNNGMPQQMFTLNNYLFALNPEKIFVSPDQGETWSIFTNNPGSFNGNLTYKNVGNDVYAFIGSQIWRITLSGSNLNFQELDNDGLQTSQITSINKVGKYAFVTTLSGLFYRDTASFNTLRK